jgi:predicted RNase H-like HicB family nuclease
MVQLDYDMIVFREGQSYVAYCPELDISSCGREVDDARANLKTAVRLFVAECHRMGTLDQVLQEAGYSPDGRGGYVSPRVVATESATVAVEA